MRNFDNLDIVKLASYALSLNEMIKSFCLFVCNRGNNQECLDELQPRKLGQSPSMIKINEKSGIWHIDAVIQANRFWR